MKPPGPIKIRTKPTLSNRLNDWIDSVAHNSPARFAIVVFSFLIVIFSILLALPISSSSGDWTDPVDAFFTAVSVVCVTGLSVVDMASHWSGFGHFVIFIGVQIGAMGVLTVTSMLGLIFARRLGLTAKLLAASDTNPFMFKNGRIATRQTIKLGEIGTLLFTIIISTVIIESILAALLLPRLLVAGIPSWEAIWQSFFYSAMAFTNTGFSPNYDGLALFSHDYWVLSTLMIGVFIGSLGFPVILALSRFIKPRQWSLHVKLTLTATISLFLIGGVVFSLLEIGNTDGYQAESPGEHIFQSFFLSAMTRSGGFAVADINELNSSSLLFADILMFIGGGSASTAGGIKVTTLAILILAAISEAKGKKDVEAFGRRIPHDVLRIAVSVLLLGAGIVSLASILLVHLSGESIERVMFDTISAFASVGLSTGFTESAGEIEKIILAITMWIGRIGTVTLGVALAASSKHQLFRRPEERPIVG